MSRKSNLVPFSAKTFDRSGQLCREDVYVFSHFFIVCFKWTKTLQFWDRVLYLPLIEIPGSKFCPVHAWIHMCKICPGSGNDPAFGIPKRQKFRPIIYNEFQNRIRSCIRQIGLNPSLFSSHSFRRGGAILAAKAGARPCYIELSSFD